MRRLGEQIESSQALQQIPPATLRGIFLRHLVQYHPDVPRLRVHVAAHIHNGLTPERNELINKVLIAPLPWRIDDQCSLLPRKFGHHRKDIRGVTRTESASSFRDVVQAGVVRGELDRISGELDTCHSLKMRGQHDREQTTAAVSIH